MYYNLATKATKRKYNNSYYIMTIFSKAFHLYYTGPSNPKKPKVVLSQTALVVPEQTAKQAVTKPHVEETIEDNEKVVEEQEDEEEERKIEKYFNIL